MMPTAIQVISYHTPQTSVNGHRVAWILLILVCMQQNTL
jgi:hypothetical protein